MTARFCNLGNKLEVYDAELHAIEEGLCQARVPTERPGRILVCVNNQVAFSTLTAGNLTNSEFARKALKTIKQLLSEGQTVSSLWTPAHCGIPGNELADALAK